MVAVTGAPSGEMLIRRAARMATRSHAELVGVHVRSDAGLADATTGLDEHRRLLADLGGIYHEVVGSDPAESLVRFALAENATQLVLGATSRPRWREVLSGGSVINRVIRSAGPIDVHVISGDETADGDGERLLPPRRRRPTALPPGRQAAGWVMCAVGIPLLTLLLLATEQHLNLPSEMLLYLLLVGAVAVVGGLWPALFAAVTTSLVVNWFFTPPVHTWTIAEADNVVALAVFLLVAGMVSLLVSRLSRRSADAVRARAEAEAIAAVAGNLVDAENALEVAVGHLRSTFGLDAVAVLQPDGDGYLIEASAGEPVPSSPEGHVSVDLRGGALLVLDGPSLHSDDLQVLHAFVAQLGAALEQRDLRAEAQVAAAAAEGDRLRTAILRAVSHDLRTPLASIKASVTSLMQHDVDWSEHDRDEFLATIEEEADRLNRMVGNLLDMSRLQSGTVEPGLRPVGLEEVVPRALVSISGEAAELGREQVVVEVGEQLPRVVADPDLLERVIANLVANALLHSGPGTPVRIEGGRVGARVDLRVVDRGIGVPLRDREAMFEPFQRMGDGVADSGVGLGLAVSRGFVDAMGGELTVDDTPGGGLTFTVSLPVAS